MTYKPVYILADHSLSPFGVEEKSILSALHEGRSPLLGIPNLLEPLLKNEMVGKIPWAWFEKTFVIENKTVANGPVEARYAYATLQGLLQKVGQPEDLKDWAIYTGTMNNMYGMVGLRNGIRVCADENLRYDKALFEKNVGTGFSYVHPMVPVYKIPNNVIANIALDFGLGGHNANFFGEDSSAMAVQEGFQKIRHNQIEKAIILSSNFIFLNILTFLLYEIQTLFKKVQQVNPEQSRFHFLSEWASAYLLSNSPQLNLSPLAEILSVTNYSTLEEFYRRALALKDLDLVVTRGLKAASLKREDLDLIIFDNLDDRGVQLQYFSEWKNQTGVLLLCPSLMIGHSLCASASAQLQIALYILRTQKVFSSYFKIVPENPLLTSSYSEVRVKRIGILSQSLNNSLQFLILEGLEQR